MGYILQLRRTNHFSLTASFCTRLFAGALLNHALNQPKEELKTHFTTREGTYKLMTMAEYSRPNRVPMNQAIVSHFLAFETQ
ncbi:unnamed protein product [Cylicostephanus goldi]|uniref:Uncharacterized protein n=1 Tax=Cylicostephanus goldi TaxID=71465 RepID=A0A3P6SPS6_CYLGO|nr:unnamed protein product [Cylicostephanus goldi]